ncbi:hypothetical protein Hypma_015977 [Hypsizygus marmoreus]|uniref:Uncharacterized protein n=1 Tax=Hypsizygus marmoreus TaxID=39966 RepID=A0A369KEJ3_HYPMA|nr:hypothetical protein Hypma_015977 [Hypsizygus marmoreus]
MMVVDLSPSSLTSGFCASYSSPLSPSFDSITIVPDAQADTPFLHLHRTRDTNDDSPSMEDMTRSMILDEQHIF